MIHFGALTDNSADSGLATDRKPASSSSSSSSSSALASSDDDDDDDSDGDVISLLNVDLAAHHPTEGAHEAEANLTPLGGETVARRECGVSNDDDDRRHGDSFHDISIYGGIGGAGGADWWSSAAVGVAGAPTNDVAEELSSKSRPTDVGSSAAKSPIVPLIDLTGAAHESGTVVPPTSNRSLPSAPHGGASSASQTATSDHPSASTEQSNRAAREAGGATIASRTTEDRDDSCERRTLGTWRHLTAAKRDTQIRANSRPPIQICIKDVETGDAVNISILPPPDGATCVVRETEHMRADVQQKTGETGGGGKPTTRQHTRSKASFADRGVLMQDFFTGGEQMEASLRAIRQSTLTPASVPDLKRDSRTKRTAARELSEDVELPLPSRASAALSHPPPQARQVRSKPRVFPSAFSPFDHIS
ncbi:PREDICTED: uncharacterized protein LOC106810218 [Priapulus caudatus]|uniref:Uncharacterized protein LOC106810218 n=1 Tax=Priapulus caudatus TaxID=37621 RepID=A0ABM1E9W7_PRICU|nr:PREDICTED: uncharacterized protein LOC106810218 [Priapulus caudatus]